MISNQNSEIFNKALLHLPPKAKKYMDIILKLNQLEASFNDIADNNISAMQTCTNEIVDIDALFRDIRPLCSGNDAKIIDMYTSFKNTHDIMAAYQAMTGGDSNAFEAFNKSGQNKSFTSSFPKY